MRYRIALHRSEEGFSVSVPGLPGCWSQVVTEAEAIDNIRDTIREYLSVVEEQLRGERRAGRAELSVLRPRRFNASRGSLHR